MELTPFEQKLIEALRDPEKGPTLQKIMENSHGKEIRNGILEYATHIPSRETAC